MGLVPRQGSWSQLCRCPQRVSWLVGWLTGVLCAEFLSKEEEEEMPAFYTSPSATCQGGEIPLWRKQLLLIPLYQGLNTSQKWWGLVNKLAGNHANGSAIVGSPPGWGSCD